MTNSAVLRGRKIIFAMRPEILPRKGLITKSFLWGKSKAKQTPTQHILTQASWWGIKYPPCSYWKRITPTIQSRRTFCFFFALSLCHHISTIIWIFRILVFILVLILVCPLSLKWIKRLWCCLKEPPGMPHHDFFFFLKFNLVVNWTDRQII